MSKIKIGPYCDLVAKENRGDELPYYPAEALSQKLLEFYASEFARIQRVFGTTVDEILAKGDSLGWFEVWTAFGIFSGWKHAHALPISQAENMIDACWWLAGEVNGGGFHQFFHNDTGDLWPFVVQALTEGSDAEGLRIFEGVMSIFPEGKPDVDRGKRWEQMDAMRDKDEEAMWAHFGSYSSAYYEHPFPDEQKMASVITARKSEIKLVWPS